MTDQPADRRILWTPTPERAAASTLAHYIRSLVDRRGLTFGSYQELWDWSVTDLDGFWRSIIDFFDLPVANLTEVIGARSMPGAEWCPGATTNMAGHILRHGAERPGQEALVLHSQTFERQSIDWATLCGRVGALQRNLRQMGVRPGDRVAAILPNTPEAIVTFLATASLGAVFSICAPDMGRTAIVDRFHQIRPKVLIVQDAYMHGDRRMDRAELCTGIADALPGLAHRVMVGAMGPVPGGWTDWQELMRDPCPPEVVQVPFSHPIWIVYSSGTTGNPKPIVHGHGGVMLEGAKQSLHQDIDLGDRFCWLTSSGWIMWNIQLTALSLGATVAIFDGAPHHPDMLAVWRMVAEERLTYFGAGAAFLMACQKQGVRPGEALDLSALESLGSTGSPLSQEGYDWVYSAVKPDVWLAPISGGTDIAGAFVLGNPMLPVRAGEMQCRALGNAVRAFDDSGAEVIGQVGELVCTAPLPSMPLYFWGDEDGSRLRESYFETYPGVWCHGDWIEFTPEGGSVIYGRSDATINRRGLRLGSSEIYRAVEGLDEVVDSLVVDLEFLGRDSFMALFVVPRSGTLDDALRERIRLAIRESVSARFLPDDIVAIAEVPRTLSGKKLEVPVKKLLLGGDPDKVVNRDSMANPESFDAFLRYAADRAPAAG